MSKDKISKEIVSKFGYQLRARVNGILIEEDKILMAKHRMGKEKEFWSTPGGGMIYGTNAHENLKREFLEETGLEIKIKEFLFVNEFLSPPLHALENFFLVERTKGTIVLGKDPELDDESQILSEICWMGLDEIHLMEKSSIHPIFWKIKSLSELGLCKGYFNFENISLK